MSATPVSALACCPPLNLNPEEYAIRAAVQSQSAYGQPEPEDPPSAYAPAVSSAPAPPMDQGEQYNEHLADIGDEPAGAPDSYWMQIVQVANLQLVGEAQLEGQDGKHRMGDLLSACLKIYHDRRGAAADQNKFYQWLDSVPEWERIAMIREKLSGMSVSPFKPMKAAGVSAPTDQGQAWDPSATPRSEPDRSKNLNPSVIRAFLHGVRYLDRAARKQYRLTFSGGLARLNGQLFDTRSMRTVFSGLGSAIWVQSPKNNFYAGNHVKGQFHHSSFLSGGEVKCGGEMQASRGVITRISAKSGHYKPSKIHFANALRTLAELGLDVNTVRVVVWKTGGAPASLIPAAVFLRDPSKWETWGTGAIPNTV